MRAWVAMSVTPCWRKSSIPRRASSAAWPACACRAASRTSSTGTGRWSRTAASACCPLLPHSQRLLRVDSLWYLDAERATLGLFEAAAEETHWLELPPLKHEHGRRLRNRLPGSRLATRVPLPQVFGEVRRSRLAPKPVLILHALTRHARLAAGTPPLGYARLAFDYAGERLPGRGGEPLVRRVRNGQLVEITRRRAEELTAMEQLERAGLTPGVDTEGLPWDVAETLPDDAWLFPGTGYAGALEVNTPARWLALRPKLEHGGLSGRVRAELSVRGAGRPGAAGTAMRWRTPTTTRSTWRSASSSMASGTTCCPPWRRRWPSIS